MAASTPVPSFTERRGTSRLRVGGTHPVRLGRTEGVLIDLSERGARVRHITAVRRGETLRLTLEWEGEQFSAQAEVLASRVASIGNGAGTIYDSRLRFVSMADTARETLLRTLSGLEARDLRRWVANLRGWEPHPEPIRHPALVTKTFVRYQLRGSWWEKKVTHDPSQPVDGFTVPADIDENEIASLCRTFEKLDAEGRTIIRLIASEVVAEAAEAEVHHDLLRNAAQ
jgi:hypothetical protein